jgi:hypothetical protein
MLRASLNDDARVVIYNAHMFIVQATQATGDTSSLFRLKCWLSLYLHCPVTNSQSITLWIWCSSLKKAIVCL